jgi:hypothetical protein
MAAPTQHSRDATAPSVFRSEPVRLFFPAGVLLGWVGVGHWLLYGHLGFGDEALGRPRPVVVLAIAIALTLLARVAADTSQSYFEHLASAALCWIVGSAVWLVWLAPRLLRR